MKDTIPHLFVDISSHGFGHLAQTAPILNALRTLCPAFRLSVRCGLPEAKVRSRISGDFSFVAGSSDFGFAMNSAVSINLVETANRYRVFHNNWEQRIGDEARFLADLRPTLVLTDVAYLPLAGATRAGIAALSMCSLNWAELFAHFFGHEPWARPIYAEMLAAYRGADCFLRLIPAMPMDALENTLAIGPVASTGARRRTELRQRLGGTADDRIAMIAFGGIDHELPVEHWPSIPGVRWLVPQEWGVDRPDMCALEPLGWAFTDLLASVDVVLTKPGYGTFTEAACNGTAVLYQRREDWPEQDCLIEWLKQNARCLEISADALATGRLRETLETLWARAAPPPPQPTGIQHAARILCDLLTGDTRSA